MATAASVIIDDAELVLGDASNDRWAEADMLTWLNLGQKAIVIAKPDANPVYEVIGPLTAGVLQNLVTHCDNTTSVVCLLDVICNMGTNGTTQGNAIRMVDRKWLDTAKPGWATVTASSTVLNVAYNPLSLPKRFLTYPAQPSSSQGYIEVVTSQLPADVATKATNINLGDEYVEPLLEYVLFRAYNLDANSNERSGQLALAHYQNFQALCGQIDLNEEIVRNYRVSSERK